MIRLLSQHGLVKIIEVAISGTNQDRTVHDPNLETLLKGVGWNGTSIVNANIVIDSNTIVMSMLTGTFPTGSKVFLLNKGLITTSTNKPALTLTSPLVLTNTGSITVAQPTTSGAITFTAISNTAISGISFATFEQRGTIEGLQV